MSPSIDIDDDVYAFLGENAEPFVDTPNSVLRRLLQIDGGAAAATARAVSASPAPAENPLRAATVRGMKSRGTPQKHKRTRAPSHALLPETEYEMPILQVLAEAGGRLPTREVVAAVGDIVADKLKELDHEVNSSGRKRWESRVQFARLALIERGELVKDSPRGVWEISDAGKARLGTPVAA